MTTNPFAILDRPKALGRSPTPPPPPTEEDEAAAAARADRAAALEAALFSDAARRPSVANWADESDGDVDGEEVRRRGRRREGEGDEARPIGGRCQAAPPLATAADHAPLLSPSPPEGGRHG